MLVVVDVVADVVQERGVGQHLAVLVGAADARADGVEQLQRQPAHVLRMRRLVVAAFGQRVHRTIARLAGVGGNGGHLRALEQESLANAIRRDHEVARLGARHHFGGDDEPGEDDVGAPDVEAAYLRALFG